MPLKFKTSLKIALAAVITAGAGTGAYAYYKVNALSDAISVPDFSGKAQRIVEIWAKKNNLEDQIKFKEEYSDDILSDCVISQSARKVSTTGTLVITLSQGPDPDKKVKLPDFSGKKKDEIEAWFEDNDFSNVTYTYTSVQDKEDDVFVSIDPSAGTKAKRSAAVTVTLARHSDNNDANKSEEETSSQKNDNTTDSNTRTSNSSRNAQSSRTSSSNSNNSSSNTSNGNSSSPNQSNQNLNSNGGQTGSDFTPPAETPSEPYNTPVPEPSLPTVEPIEPTPAPTVAPITNSDEQEQPADSASESDETSSDAQEYYN